MSTGFTGFIRSYATSILADKIDSDHYIGLGLASSAPQPDGTGFSEPSADNGYKRSKIGTLDASKEAQLANKEIIFFNESINAGYGTVGYFGLFTSASVSTPYFVGRLTDSGGAETTLTIGAEYVPIFRDHELVIGLDKEELESYE